jgi:hypothetical protein
MMGLKVKGLNKKEKIGPLSHRKQQKGRFGRCKRLRG